MLIERLGKTVLRDRLGEQCVDRRIGGTMCQERDLRNTVLRERMGNTVLRESLWKKCAERKIGEHSAKREFGGTM